MFYTYITTNKRNGTLYTGHTDDIWRCASEHRDKAFGGFSAQYDGCHLVWFEEHPTREAAFKREQQIKQSSRAWTLGLIEQGNPYWLDLSESDIDIYVPEGELLAVMLPQLIQRHAFASI